MPSNALVSATSWFQTLLLGPVATIVAIMAVAVFGLFLFQGRLDWRGGLRTLFGCFLIFGAPAIAAGLLNVSSAPSFVPAEAAHESEVVPPPPRPPEIYDPYAGAAVAYN